MGAPTSALGLLVQAELKKKDVMRFLHTRALKLSDWHEEDAKDLLSKSLTRVLDEDDEPFREGTHPFLAHMFVVMRQTQYRLWRRVEKEAEVLESGLAEGTAGDELPRDDDELARKRSLAVLRKLGPQVLAALQSDDVIARELYQSRMLDDPGPAQERLELNCTAPELEAAVKRLTYQATKARDAWDASEERRMSALRSQTRTKHEEERL